MAYDREYSIGTMEGLRVSTPRGTRRPTPPSANTSIPTSDHGRTQLDPTRLPSRRAAEPSS
ncbi:hypothetical protein M406DRAFT_322377 [Cryphonectria parasitica EP155]|uniref:Uncharacterized protein n=1 Tax=Cryphonectria parasitica (strain ATCC 38755 / EP155) TaxID=660469 RepID=A0A9P5CQN8_CRYP1|nr:uncharacterized protein M406DRAFT_322377 [Cryphonectria parasitica EP155]KAF3766416.1 hypothetical protein M406DRAFT_322377 [Cryphonectria parasitica EP155]